MWSMVILPTEISGFLRTYRSPTTRYFCTQLPILRFNKYNKKEWTMSCNDVLGRVWIGRKEERWKREGYLELKRNFKKEWIESDLWDLLLIFSARIHPSIFSIIGHCLIENWSALKYHDRSLQMVLVRWISFRVLWLTKGLSDSAFYTMWPLEICIAYMDTSHISSRCFSFSLQPSFTLIYCRIMINLGVARIPRSSLTRYMSLRTEKALKKLQDPVGHSK